MKKLVFLDTETTGLNPDLHDVWEIGLIVRADDDRGDAEKSWMVRPDLAHADPNALEVGSYYKRFVSARATDSDDLAVLLARILAGAVVVGSNPAFDERFLSRWLQRHGQCWSAHYRTVDVVTLGWGRLMAKGQVAALVADAPPSSASIAAAHGIDLDAYDRHTALGDCRWVRDLYDAITKEA